MGVKVAFDPSWWQIGLDKLQTDLQDTVPLNAHLLAPDTARASPWMDEILIHKEKKPRKAEKSNVEAKQRYLAAGLEYPEGGPQYVDTMLSDQFVDEGVPAATVFYIDRIDRRQKEMLYYLVKKENLFDTAIRFGKPLILPMEKSWAYFKASGAGQGPTLCGSSRSFVADFSQAPYLIRPLLPEEMYSMQGMTLFEMYKVANPSQWLCWNSLFE